MKWAHFTFCSIWLVTACVFGILAYESYQASNTTLFRFSSDVPSWGNVKILGVDLGKTLNQMSDTNNKNVGLLESSIHQSAKLTFLLNIISCLMAFSGFVAQVFDHRYKNNHHG